jgi:hypothetical protein
MKICSKCKQNKDIILFHKNSSQADGLNYRCKDCHRKDVRLYKRKYAEKTRFWNRQYQKNHQHIYNMHQAKRHIAKLKRTPKWLTKDDWILIQMKYELAMYLTEVTGMKWEVDHIIPLQGENISGLHVPNNLRVITKYENYNKGNR